MFACKLRYSRIPSRHTSWPCCILSVYSVAHSVCSAFLIFEAASTVPQHSQSVGRIALLHWAQQSSLASQLDVMPRFTGLYMGNWTWQACFFLHCTWQPLHCSAIGTCYSLTHSQEISLLALQLWHQSIDTVSGLAFTMNLKAYAIWCCLVTCAPTVK